MRRALKTNQAEIDLSLEVCSLNQHTNKSMLTNKLIAASILLATSSAMAAQLYKPGASPEETKALVAECQMEATKSTGSMDPITYGRTQRQANILGFGKALLATFTEYNVFTLCLKAKGFTDGSTADSAYSQAQYKLPSGYGSLPSIKVEIPSYVEEGGVVPINLVLEGIEPTDPVESATVVVDSNPQDHRHALTVQYMQPPTKFGLRLRVRLAETTKPTISVIVTFKSGNSVTKTFGPDRVAKFVNFMQPDTLVPMPATTAKLFSSQEIGQQRAKLGGELRTKQPLNRLTINYLSAPA